MAMKRLASGRFFSVLIILALSVIWLYRRDCSCKNEITGNDDLEKIWNEKKLRSFETHRKNLTLNNIGKFVYNIWKNKKVEVHPGVNIVPSTLPENFNLSHQDCIPLPHTARSNVVICVHAVDDDIWVSGELKKGKLWEEENVLQTKFHLEKDVNMVFLDLGANIGEYTLYVAALGRHVLTVEMLPSNVQHIQKALALSGLGQNVTIVNNALYSDHRILDVKFLNKNIGGTRLNVSHSDESINSRQAVVKAHTICLNDLVPLMEGSTVFMKMDIENSEHYALKCADLFIQKTNVKVIQMEWLNRGNQESEDILKFMAIHGYQMSLVSSHIAPVDYNHIPGNVYFLKAASLQMVKEDKQNKSPT